MAKTKGIGGLSYMIGFFGAVIVGLLAGFGLFTAGAIVTTILALAGLGIGLFNINSGERGLLLTATIAVALLSGLLSNFGGVGQILTEVFNALFVVFGVTALVIAFGVFQKVGK